MVVIHRGNKATIYQSAKALKVSSTTPSGSTTSARKANASATTTTPKHSSATAKVTCSTTVKYGGTSSIAKVSSTTSKSTSKEASTTTGKVSSTMVNKALSTIVSRVSSTTANGVTSATINSVSSATANRMLSTIANNVSSATANRVLSTIANNVSSATANRMLSTIANSVSSATINRVSSATINRVSSTTVNRVSSTTTYPYLAHLGSNAHKEIEEILVELGFDSGVDGNFINAINKFKYSNGMEKYGSYSKELVNKLVEMKEKQIEGTIAIELNDNSYCIEHRSDLNGIGMKEDGTVIMGKNVTLDDAFTVVLLDKWQKAGVKERKIKDFVKEYIEKKDSLGEETVIVKDKTIEYYTKCEDITTKLLSEMIKNEYEYTMFDLNGELHRINEVPSNWINYLMEFKVNVQNKGPWDLKQKAEWKNSSLYYFDGEIVDKDAPGNIMYGYMGKAYGIPDDILYLAAGYAQLSAGTSKSEFAGSFFDDPIDQENIRRGIEFYNKTHGR